MDLFTEKQSNILPYDGTVIYYGIIFSKTEADHFTKVLLDTIEWRQDEAVIYGKHYKTDRKVAWYGNEAYSYTYSGATKSALPWTPELMELREKIQKSTKSTYNSCLLNLYHTGEEGMAWHSDGEKMLLKGGSIASLSFGAERKFAFKHKRTKEKVEIVLANGSLLEMKNDTQTNWLHRLPPTVKVKTPRVNLTFRTIAT